MSVPWIGVWADHQTAPRAEAGVTRRSWGPQGFSMRLHELFFIVLLGLLGTEVLAQSRPLRVAMIVPAEGTRGDFWFDFPEMAKVAARQLGMELDVRVAARWPGGRVSLVRSILEGPNRPDYLVTTVHMGIRTQELEVAEKAGVPVFIVNAGLRKEDLERVGGPREHFKFWIGQMLPDERRAGQDEAEWLIREARRRFGKQALSLLAFGGRETDWPALERNEGLMQALAKAGDVRLNQLVFADYLLTEARDRFPAMLKRYPKANLVWSANDPMALGALEALQSMGRIAGSDLLFGGIDWDPKALKAIKEGRMVVSMGGHVFDGAWTMVLLYDHAKGIDFAKERVDWRTRMYPITRENVDVAIRFFSEKRWDKIDFRRFSKAYRPEMVRYQFGAEYIPALNKIYLK